MAILLHKWFNVKTLNALFAILNLVLITQCVNFIMITLFLNLEEPMHVDKANIQILTNEIDKSILELSSAPGKETLSKEQFLSVQNEVISNGKQFHSCFHKLRLEWYGSDFILLENKMRIWNAISSSKYAVKETIAQLPLLLRGDNLKYYKCVYF